MKRQQIIELLEKLSKESGYELHFSDVDISVKGKQLIIKGIRK